MRIIIAGEPIAQQRPRFARRGVFVQTYNPQETEAGRWLLSARTQITEKLGGALEVKCDFVFSRPKSHFGTGKNYGKLKISAPMHCVNNKDVDNLIKMVLDCLNREAYSDDRQIVSVSSAKRWADVGEVGHTMVEILALQGGG